MVELYGSLTSLREEAQIAKSGIKTLLIDGNYKY